MSPRTSHELKPFLGSKEDGLCESDIPQNGGYSYRASFARNIRLIYGIQIFILMVNVGLLISNLRALQLGRNGDFNGVKFDKTISPALPALRYTIKETDTNPSPFIGEPRPELDQAWSHLLRSSIIRLSEDEMRDMNKTSIALKDGTGYIGYVEAVHMLHCVRIYQYKHQDHYPEIQDTDEFLPGHWDHCLEVLREGILCNADMTVNTYFWKSDDYIKGNRQGPRKCTDWSLVQSWIGDRAVNFESREGFLDTLVRHGEPGSMGPVYT